MALTAMKDLARSPEELKKSRDIPMAVAERVSGPTYPYGTTMCLEDETLAKLGIKGELPKAGDTFHLVAMARVTCSSETERTTEGGGKEVCRRIELQITHMACENEDEETPARGDRWYGADKAEPMEKET